MFDDKRPLSREGNTGTSLAMTSYNKLQMWKAIPFQINKVQPRRVVIDEDGVPTTVSLSRVTAASGAKRAPSRNGAARCEKKQNAHDKATESTEDVSKFW